MFSENEWDKLYRMVKTKFALSEDKGTSKVCSLKEAIRTHVKPGMALHFTFTSVRWPNAAIFEIARQFWGTRPEFTMINVSANHPHAILIHGGLVKKLIISYCGDPFYTISPNKVFQRAWKNNQMEIENWTILTIILRLKAAALGVPFVTTNSIIGSGIEEENKDLFKVIDDPFGSGKKVGLVSALYPDLSFIHGWVADKYGDTIILPPYLENTYGAMASKNGTIVTVEKIVDTEYIRKNSHFMVLPGDYVKCVCEVPFGAHPSGLINKGLEDFEGYAEDYDFVDQANTAAKEHESFDRWVKEWVLGCKDHNDYLRKLGAKRVFALKGKSHSNSWEYELDAIDALKDKITDKSYTPLEMAIVVEGRKLKEKIKAGNYKTVLAGAGTCNLGAWLAYYDLKNEGYNIELMAELGIYGYIPRPLDPGVFNQRNLYTCKGLVDNITVMGIYMGGANNQCIGALGFGEIDKYGNINTTKIPGKNFIAGSGGGNDIATCAQEVLTLGVQDKKRFLEKVSYITSPGDKVKTLVSDLGVYEKLPGENEFTLVSYFPNEKFSSVEENIRNIKENCGWDLKIAQDIYQEEPPAPDELIMLRIFDPYRCFLD